MMLSGVMAQPFSLIPPGRQISILGSDSQYVFLRVDSSELQGADSVFYLNKQIIASDIPGCDWFTEQPSYLGEKIIHDGTYYKMLNRDGDTLYYDTAVAAPWVFYTYPDGSYIELQPWVFVEQQFRNLPGYRDSFKLARMQAFNSGGSSDPSNPWQGFIIGASENNGISRWVNFYDFPHVIPIEEDYWSGISDRDTGYVNIDARRVWDLQPGNERHWANHERSGDATDYTDIQDIEKRFVLSRWESGDTIYLEQFRVRQRMQFQSLTNLTDTSFLVDTMIEAISLADYSFLDPFPLELAERNQFGYSIQQPDTNCFNRQQKTVLDIHDAPFADCISWDGDSLPYLLFTDGVGWNKTEEVFAGDPEFNFKNREQVFYQKGLDECGTRIDFDSLLATSVSEPDLSFDFQLYPNPSQQYINVLIPDIISADLQIRIMDLQGRVIRADQLSGDSIRINLQNLKPGMYFLEISGEQHYAVRSFIKN
jgi:hypothetical protein